MLSDRQADSPPNPFPPRHHLPGAFIDPTFFLSRAVSNVISSVVFGDRFDYEDKEFLSLLRMMLGSFQFTSTSTGQVTGPSLALLRPCSNLLTAPPPGDRCSKGLPSCRQVLSEPAFSLKQFNSCTRSQDRVPISSLQSEDMSTNTVPTKTRKTKMSRKEGSSLQATFPQLSSLSCEVFPSQFTLISKWCPCSHVFFNLKLFFIGILSCSITLLLIIVTQVSFLRNLFSLLIM